MRGIDLHDSGRALMLFLLGLLTYLLAARGIQHSHCPVGSPESGAPCAVCPLQGGCLKGVEAR